MKYTLNFLKVITQIAVVATVTFILPALLHGIITLNMSHYLMDILSGDYQMGMAFVSIIVTILYIVALSMEHDERKVSKF
jgi:uncharacterized membrane protein